MYVAYRGDRDYSPPSIVIGTEVQFRRTGVRVMEICRIMIDSGDAWQVHGTCRRVQPHEAIAQADTFLGIVVKVERYLKQQKAEVAL
jgi:hypothetical protein